MTLKIKKRRRISTLRYVEAWPLETEKDHHQNKAMLRKLHDDKDQVSKTSGSCFIIRLLSDWLKWWPWGEVDSFYRKRCLQSLKRIQIKDQTNRDIYSKYLKLCCSSSDAITYVLFLLCQYCVLWDSWSVWWRIWS